MSRQNNCANLLLSFITLTFMQLCILVESIPSVQSLLFDFLLVTSFEG